jgi:hypothetical protein
LQTIDELGASKPQQSLFWVQGEPGTPGTLFVRANPQHFCWVLHE